MVVAQGRGRFASAVVVGAHQRATELGLAVKDVHLAELATAGPFPEVAILIVGTFTEDLAAIEQIRAGGLLGCVAAGLLSSGIGWDRKQCSWNPLLLDGRHLAAFHLEPHARDGPAALHPEQPVGVGHCGL